MRKTNVLRNFWYGLTSEQRVLVRKLYYFPVDFIDKIRGKRNKYVPPRGLIYTGSPDNAEAYLIQGQNQLNLLINTINLEQNDAVLDIGSGVGRTAIALSGYLNLDGSYDGFDVVKSGVDWCLSGLAKDYKNFNFKYVPVFNDLYNTATLKATDFEFPFKNNKYNKVFSFSLFTHMQIEEIIHYFSEISRVLKQDGLCFSTFFLYDDLDENIIINKKDFAFPHAKDGYRLMSENTKSGNIAIHKTKLNTMLTQSNLKLVKFVDGYWKDGNYNEDKKLYQDIVIFKKLK